MSKSQAQSVRVGMPIKSHSHVTTINSHVTTINSHVTTTRMLKCDLTFCLHHWCITGATWVYQPLELVLALGNSGCSNDQAAATGHSYLDLSATGGQILSRISNTQTKAHLL